MREVKQSWVNLCYASGMERWFPRIADLVVPRSVFLAFPPNWLDWFDEEQVPDAFTNLVKMAATTFGYPLFMRSDQSSCKHDWENGCFVPSASTVPDHLWSLFEHHVEKYPPNPMPRWLVLREYIPMATAFLGFRGMPINHEHRYFVEGTHPYIRDEDGICRTCGVAGAPHPEEPRILCHHPYWPAEAIEEGFHSEALIENWRDLLRGISECYHPELDAVALQAAERVEGFWSVDFCESARGEWYLIDMGKAEASYHAEGCPSIEEIGHAVPF